MSLRAVFIDRKKLTDHGALAEALTELLLGLHKYQVAVFDIGQFSEGENPSKEEICRRAAAFLGQLDLALEDSLMIADCEETVQLAREWKVAVLGYEPPQLQPENPEGGSAGSVRRMQSHLDMLVEGFEEVDFYFLERVYQRFHGLPWTVIETERCYLRELTIADLDGLYELYRPEAMTEYMDGLYEDREKEEAYTRAYIENMYRFYGYGLWVVLEKSTDCLIGRAGLSNLEVDGAVQLELGYAIAQDRQRQGYATEVCQGILDYATEGLEMPVIYCLIQKENIVSVHLAEKLGFQWEKTVLCNGRKMERYKKNLIYEG